MRRLVPAFFLFALAAEAIAAQAPDAALKINAVLVDKDLNQKPVPHLANRALAGGAGEQVADPGTPLHGKLLKQGPTGTKTVRPAGGRRKTRCSLFSIYPGGV